MAKIPIYFMPGFAAGPTIFEYLQLSLEIYDLYYLEWKIPLSSEESIESYALRMCSEIKAENPVLIGVSFGGILIQEMSSFLNIREMIIISSVKTNDEIPTRLKVAKQTKIYKLFPTKIISNFEDYTHLFIGNSLKKRAEIYKKYLSVRDPTYLNWCVYAILHWKNKKPMKNIIHIHGTNDQVFPLKHIKNVIEIKGGDHSMILTKAKEISSIINKILTPNS